MSSKANINSKKPFPSFWTVGFSIFAMFFGAGNIVFPLSLGVNTTQHIFPAISGLLLTAVGVPLLGLIAMTAFNCNYRNFFDKIGSIPGFIIIVAILALIGPLAGIPRALNISYGTTMWGTLPLFVSASIILIFIFSYKPSFLISWMGNFFSPIILLIFFFVIFKGLFFSSIPPQVISQSLRPDEPTTALAAFFNGFITGFNTMDLLAAFFFSSVVVKAIGRELSDTEEIKNDSKTAKTDYQLVTFMSKASCLSAFLLSCFYIGFFLLAVKLSGCIEDTSAQTILRKISELTLGKFTIFLTTAVFLACFTTEIALSGVFAQFLSYTTQNKLTYMPALVCTLAVSLCFSLLQFDGISFFLTPILKVLYPALIVLCVVNILYKTKNFAYVKTCFYSTLLISLAFNLLG